MKTLSIDIETYSDVPLQKTGVYRYVESPNFEILLFAYSVDSQPVQVIDLACGEQIPKEILLALEDENVIKWAFNATFERICLSRFLGYPTGEYLKPESWHCSMIWSATMGLPLSLEGVGAVLGLEKQKFSEGKDLIKYFCQPCAPTKANGQRTRNRPFHAPDKWALFKKYNIRDVETEMGIQQRLAKFPVLAQVWEEYHLDPDQAAVVKRIFADILSGKSTNAIADELNAEKVPSKKNNHWTSSTIRGILANEKYTGDVIFQKTYTDETFNRHTNYGEVDQYMAPDHHEAIISHSDFDAANALVNQRTAEKGIDKRLMETTHYLGDSFYPAIIDKDTYQKAQEESKSRATALGRNNKKTQMRKLQIPTRFHMGEVAALYDNPVKQAEYLYSLIESESK
ncbi:MAG TPA: hypothetical protein DCX86_01500 [Coprococcus sp.]|nr:hypothetical protein [Coprococcus sp.]